MALAKTIYDILPKQVVDFLLDLLVYVCNHVVCHVPSHLFRLWFYRNAMGWKIGSQSSIHERLRFHGVRGGVSIGDNVCIAQDVSLNGPGYKDGDIIIGNNVAIAHQVFIVTGGHKLGPMEGYAMTNRPVIIEDHAVIFARAMLVMCRIGRGAVVLPGAVVTSDVEPFTIVGGVPARKVKDREPKIDPTYRLFWRWRFH